MTANELVTGWGGAGWIDPSVAATTGLAGYAAVVGWFHPGRTDRQVFTGRRK